MRSRLVGDLKLLHGVHWAALVGPDGMSVESWSHGQTDDKGAMWMGLMERAEKIGSSQHEVITVLAENATITSRRIDDAHFLLVGADSDVNLGALRQSISQISEKLAEMLPSQ